MLQQKIKRHGYHLMSLASLGMFCIGMAGLILTTMHWMPHLNPQASWSIAGIEWKQSSLMDTQGKWLVSAAGMLWTLAYLAPLVALRRLGHSLYKSEALSRPMADAFRWLAHSLLGFAVLNAASFTLASIAAEANKMAPHGLPFSASGCYLFLIACLCLYSIAHLMRLATDAADDARSII